MEFLNKIADFLLSNSYSTRKKVAYLIFGIMVLWLGDIYFGFSEGYRINQKIERLDKIEKIKRDYQLSDTVKQQLDQLELSLFSERRIYDFLPFSESDNKSLASDSISTTHIIKTKPSANIIDPFWHIISSSFFFVLLAMMVPLAVFSEFNLNTLLGALFAEVLFVLLILFYSYALALIPIISPDAIWLNYGINFVIHLITVIPVYRAITKPKSLRKNK